MPLDIVVVGAGIAGLTAAVALQRGGHRVRIYESSKFAAETGAAINVTSNGVKVLESFGFDFRRSRAIKMQRWTVTDGVTLETISSQDLEQVQEKFGSPYWAVHRVDIHNELMRLANVSITAETTPVEKDIGAIELHLASKVVDVDVDEGVITLEDGTKRRADLIVGADGLHSVLRDAVVNDHKQAKLIATGMSAFRFLIPTEKLQATTNGQDLLAWKPPGVTAIVDTVEPQDGRHLIWYPCRDNTIQNFVGIHPTMKSSEAHTDFEAQLRQQFAQFNPKIVQLLDLADHTNCWPLCTMEPLSTWSAGKTVLIGDAAHPMLPFSGQGANQAIEDGGVLGYLLNGVSDVSRMPSLLEQFRSTRFKRATRVQILSSVRATQEHQVMDKIQDYMEPGIPLPDTFAKRVAHDAGFDAIGNLAKDHLPTS